MKSLREFVGSSSGLAPMRQGQGLGWVISALAGVAVLLGAKEVESDKCEYRAYDDCGYNVWCASRNEATPIRCRTTHPDCSFEYFCTSRAEAEQAGASFDVSEATESDKCEYRTYDDCGYNVWCASRNEDTPIRCRTTHPDCSFEYFCTSRAEAEEATPTVVLTPAVAGRPMQHRLGDAYPNPFNPAMVIPLDLATDQQRVHLALYDVLGRRVRQLWDGPLRMGSHRFVWDGRDEVGKGVAAGVYIYKVEVDGQIEAKKTTKLP